MGDAAGWDGGHADGWIVYYDGRQIADLSFLEVDGFCYMFALHPGATTEEELRSLFRLRPADPAVVLKNKRSPETIIQDQDVCLHASPDLRTVSLRDFRTPPRRRDEGWVSRGWRLFWAWLTGATA
jgi:hypothetical protein